MISFFLGGARSGKSRRALTVAGGGVFIATAEITDSEFEKRISQHQQERGPEWRTIECALDLSQEISRQPAGSTLLVDCLTVWLGNLMHYERDVRAETELLVSTLTQSESDIFLVSNEVGQGVVPEHPMGREFRDWQGRLNQQVAKTADRVELLVAGIPLTVKS